MALQGNIMKKDNLRQEIYEKQMLINVLKADIKELKQNCTQEDESLQDVEDFVLKNPDDTTEMYFERDVDRVIIRVFIPEEYSNDPDDGNLAPELDSYFDIDIENAIKLRAMLNLIINDDE